VQNLSARGAAAPPDLRVGKLLPDRQTAVVAHTKFTASRGVVSPQLSRGDPDPLPPPRLPVRVSERRQRHERRNILLGHETMQACRAEKDILDLLFAVFHDMVVVYYTTDWIGRIFYNDKTQRGLNSKRGPRSFHPPPPFLL
jgi:hypothetical protein